MLKISKSNIVRVDGTSRLCADLTIGDRRTTLWFAVDSTHEEWLTPGRADPFVVMLLPAAMRSGQEMICEDPMSQRLHYQLTHGMIATLAFAGEPYRSIRITAPLTSEKVSSQGAVGTGFTGGVDCLYTIMRHDAHSELPLSHIAVFNTGYMETKEIFWRLFHQAERFGVEQGLDALFVDTNCREILSERFGDVYTYRNLACVLALGGLFSTYLLSSGPDASKLDLNPRKCARYDLLTVNCVSTESLSVYLSGAETVRVEKLTALTQWEPSRHWLHPCIGVIGEEINCSHCRKCIRDMTMLYGLGELENYREVFDVDDYLRHLPERIGFVLAGRGSNTCNQVLRLLETHQVSIPSAAYVYEKQFRRAMKNLKNSLG